MKVFIVENHRDTLMSLTLFFEDRGHQVESAMSVAEAHAALATAAPDILFCDIGLPDGTGWDLLRNLPSTRPRLCVAMSGFGMNADNTRSRDAGFRNHLLKPFKIAELERILEQAALELSAA